MQMLQLFTSFHGRIGRQSYWVGYLTLTAIYFLSMLLDMSLGTTNYGFGTVNILTSIVLLYPSLALNAKRWHDRDRSGWWTLILLVPVFGALWMSMQLGFLKGVGWENQYGPDPLKHGRVELKR